MHWNDTAPDDTVRLPLRTRWGAPQGHAPAARVTPGSMTKTLAALLVGVALGIGVTVTYIEASGGLYTYTVLSKDECAEGGHGLEVAPNQPNPCQLRYRRFH